MDKKPMSTVAEPSTRSANARRFSDEFKHDVSLDPVNQSAEDQAEVGTRRQALRAGVGRPAGINEERDQFLQLIREEARISTRPAFSRSTRWTIWLSIPWAAILSTASGTRRSLPSPSLYWPHHFLDLPVDLLAGCGIGDQHGFAVQTGH